MDVMRCTQPPPIWPPPIDGCCCLLPAKTGFPRQHRDIFLLRVFTLVVRIVRYTAMRSACANNHPDCVRQLVAAGSHPELECTWTREDGTQGSCVPLEVACCHGHDQCVQMLLEAGISRETLLSALIWTQKASTGSCARMVKRALESLQ